MPELPEVETTIRDLQKKVLARTFFDVWTDWQKTIRLRQGFGGQVKKPKDFAEFKKEVKGKKILKIWRRAKNIIFTLSDGYSLLVHLKMTGHLLVGKWKFKNKKLSAQSGPLSEKINNFIHVLFTLDNGQMLALSDLRKFAKIELWKTKELLDSPEFKNIGPEPLAPDFSFAKFKEILQDKRGKIKQVLMKPEVIAGIGNIYSDEILWEAKIHPFRETSKLKEAELKKIYKYIKIVLEKAVKLRGTSISDFRDTEGKPGFYSKVRKVYQREGEKCLRCGAAIKRLKMGGRSAHFCPHCQKY